MYVVYGRHFSDDAEANAGIFEIYLEFAGVSLSGNFDGARRGRRL